MACIEGLGLAAEGETCTVRSFRKESLVNGKSVEVACLGIRGQTYAVSGGVARIVRLEDEWYDDVEDPNSVIATLKTAAVKADLFTFWQRIPDVEPRFRFYRESEPLAVLPVTSFEHWWNHQIKSRTRNLIRKTEKAGVEIREACYDDAFVRGMTAIFNETPIRQGRRFWHYGKDVETVKRQFSRHLSREDLIGAYYQGELIGLVMLGNAGHYAVTGQIISKIEHRDKATNNALIAKSVEVCARRGLPYLVYLHWGSGSLAEFKRRCGFGEVCAPRYYVPLTARGRVALRLGWHRGWRDIMPPFVKSGLKTLRARATRADGDGMGH